MKLLNLAIKNLASLTQVNIDFEQAPLEQSGLFAITGDTGSGKSTLLDAICLALYGKTARLKNDLKNTVAFNGDDIKLNDPRNLLRRGCAQGRAEVTFVGQDGEQYLARWTIERAYKKANGKLKKADHQLFCVKGEQLITQSSSTTIKKVEQLVGLNFEQFTRAVLLAQHEFAAFLKASSDERAQLLECLTGTDKFSKLGQAIFERHKQKKAELEQLQASMAHFNVLSDEALNELQAQITLKTEQIEQLKQQVTSYQQDIQWLQQGQQQQNKLADYQQQLTTLELQLNEQAPQVKEAQLGMLTAQVADNRAHHTRLLSQYDELKVQYERLAAQSFESQLQAKAHELGQAEQAFQEATSQLENTGPIIKQVRVLDNERTLATEQVKQAGERVTHTKQQAVELATQLSQQQNALADNKAQQAQLNTKISNAYSFAQAAQHWPNLENLFANMSEQSTRLEAYRQEKQQLKKTHAQLSEQLSPLNEQLISAQAAHKQLEQQLHTVQQQLEPLDYETLQKRHYALKSALQLSQQIAQCEHEQLQLKTSIDKLRHEQNALKQQLRDTEQQTELHKQRVVLTQDNLTQVQLRASNKVSELRAQLKAGQECMVCGAKEHPYGVEHIDSHWQNLINDFTEQKNKAEQAQQQSQQRYNEQLVAHEQVHAQLQTSLQRQAQIKEQCVSHTHQLHELGFAQQLDLEQGQAQLLEIEHNLTQYSALSRQQQQYWQALNDEQQGIANIQAQQTSMQQEQHAVDAQLQSLTLQAQELTDAYATQQTKAQQYYQEHDWWQSYTAQPNLAFELLSTRVNEFLSWQKSLSDLLQNEKQLASELSFSEQAHEKLNATVEELQKKLSDYQHSLTTLSTTRESLLTLAKSADDWLMQLQTQRDKAQSHVATAQNAVAQLEQDIKEQTLKLTHIQQQLSDNQKDQVTTEERFAQWLNTQQKTYPELNESKVRQLLALPISEFEQCLKVYQQQQEAYAQALAKLNHLHDEIEQHQTQARTNESQQTVQEQLNLAEQSLANTQSQWLEYNTTFKQHQQNVAQRAEQQVKLSELQTRYEHWHLLDKLLGDATGKKLRNIAQTQTLKILLQYANQHLASLSKRYRLTVIGHSLNIAIIDKDMADEQRSVNTLSGGESFLVSLALALGLASLSANQVRINSLFIDEGFGTLDPETLSVALDALDSLQAQGRKVGVISHVSEMTERVATQIHVKKQPGGYSSIQIKG